MKPIQNQAIPISTTPEEYIEFERAADFKIGEFVYVVRSAFTNEGGWNNSWNDKMNEFVGKCYQVLSANHGNGSGIGLGDGFRFPYFVLDRVIEREDTNV